MNLVTMLEKTVSQYARRTAIIVEERKFSYAELDEASNRVANALLERGVQKGDRVATLVANSFEFVAIYFGIARVGGIAVPLDIRYVPEELAHLFANCQPKVLLAESAILAPVVPHLPGFNTIKHVIKLGAGLDGQFPDYAEVLAQTSNRRVYVETFPEDIATISYTGGPTNHPHGVVLTHRSLVTEAELSVRGFRQTEKDVVMLFALPMYHMFGMASVGLSCCRAGSTIVAIPGTGRSISSLLEAIAREHGTIYMGVPYIYALAISVAEREGIKSDLSSMRMWISGGAPISLEIIEQFKRYYGVTIMDIWGMTESVSHVTCPPLNAVKIGATGKPVPPWELKIVDNNGRELPPRKSGEIIVRGPIMKCYYRDPEHTAEAIKDGWLYTGDVGKVDEEGYLYITGRKKDMLILKGQNVYPHDIEEVVAAHPKVAEVRMVGVPDKLRGEVVGVIIRLKPGVSATEQEIRRFCQEHMSDFKTPKEIIFTDSVLETAAKIQCQNPFSALTARALLASGK